MTPAPPIGYCHDGGTLHTRFLPSPHTQIELLEAVRARVAALVEADGTRDEVLVDAIANDLVGARLVIRAALAAPPPGVVSGAAREALEASAEEAEDLLRMVLDVLGGTERR